MGVRLNPTERPLLRLNNTTQLIEKGILFRDCRPHAPYKTISILLLIVFEKTVIARDNGRCTFKELFENFISEHASDTNPREHNKFFRTQIEHSFFLFFVFFKEDPCKTAPEISH